jgi:hypothetical protein
MRRNAEPGSSVRSFTVWIELVWLKEGATFSRGAYARLLHACELSVTDLSFDRIERARPQMPHKCDRADSDSMPPPTGLRYPKLVRSECNGARSHVCKLL